MFKLTRWSLLVLIFLGCIVISLSIYAFRFDPNFTCFGAFSPSAQHIEVQANVRLPLSTSNLEWRCQPFFESFDIHMRFEIAPNDMMYIITTPGYRPFNPIDPTSDFDFFDGDPMNEQDFDAFSTWQGNSSCGFTNVLIDMRDPDIYVVYAHYHGWEDC